MLNCLTKTHTMEEEGRYERNKTLIENKDVRVLRGKTRGQTSLRNKSTK